MTEAYEQMHIRPEDVGKTTFSTIFGTFQSRVMQMGDCNALHISAVNDHYIPRFPQKICTHISRRYTHILSEYLRAHKAYNESASMTQRVPVLLSRSKLDLFSDKTDCLGHVIDDNGIHAELDKMRQIREWRIP